MNELLTIIAKLGIELHPDRINILASSIEKIESVEYFSLVKSSFSSNSNRTIFSQFDTVWKNNKKITPLEVASALRSASATAIENEKRGKAEIVWTGPSTGNIPVRHTEQVLCEVINTATRELFIVSFVAYEIDSVTKALRDAIGRNVKINLLLELSTEHGGKVKQDSIKMMDKLFPSANIYSWSTKAKTDSMQQIGAIHAKCAIADDKLALITSANLTPAAMERNIELGVLIRGGTLPLELHKHFGSMILSELFEKIM
jgi:phosphatidylserine/phosphatidylglycerophosphate/cardiolipin synthase-like enzyme